MIRSEDIVYQDNRIVILNPYCKKGVVIGAPIPKKTSIYQFNVPYFICDINYSTPFREVLCSYGFVWLKRTYIRVDPEKTYIDESNIRLIDYMKQKYNISIFQQFLKNDSNKYHISVHVSKLSIFNVVTLGEK